jgi:hypothetical protein
MSDPLDVHRSLEHCMQNIEAGREAMAHDMHDAAMRLGAAEMMLASAGYAVDKHAAAPIDADIDSPVSSSRHSCHRHPDTRCQPRQPGAVVLRRAAARRSGSRPG